jgi:UDP-glucose 4-epimerase
MPKVLVTGMSGSLARLTALELVRRGDDVIGIDYRPPPPDLPAGVTFFQANYNKTRIEDAFRRHRPEVVLHLGRVGNLKVSRNKRFDLNVVGSAKVQELCLKYGARRLVVLSTFHIYGAHPHNHIPIQEDEPLRALQTIPQLADAVQLDNQAVTWTFRHREHDTIVLRPTNVVGAHIGNTISRMLRRPTLAWIAGFNPMWQFVHETDLLRALLLTLSGEPRSGVYNVAGRGALPLVEALKLTGARVFPVPSPLVEAYLRLVARDPDTFPQYMIDFLKYPTIIADERFRRDFDYTPRIPVDQAIRSCVSHQPLEPILGQA